MKINNDYRADIDGLRALAIISVILFHLDKTLLPGGFTGVDIFFVISGFLITSHIINDTLKGTFSFKKFYIRRVKRILPALLGVIIFVLVGSFVIFTQFYFEKTGMESLAAILSFSNIYFYTSAGYFDDNIIFKPLLHTWSLGVEEQFYLFWPIIILLFLNFNKLKNIIWFFVILGILSFVLNYIFLTSKEAIFYLVPFRVFEFIIGAFVAYILLKQNKEHKKKYQNALSVIGLVLIIYPFFMLDENAIFPFYNALYTIFGTGLIIYSKNGYINKLLSLKFFVWIGLISYSLYLYHWPSIVFISYLHDSKLDSSLYIYILTLTIALSLLSYFYIEKKFRYMENKKSLQWISITAMVLLLLSSFVISGLIKSIPSNKLELITPEEFSNAQSKRYSLVKKGCTVTALKDTKRCNMTAPIQIMTMGNSHAIDGYNMVHSKVKNNEKINLIHLRTTTGCGYELKNNRVISTTNKCSVEADFLSNSNFIRNLDVLVVHFFKFKDWAFSAVELIDFIKAQNPDIKIIVVGSYIGLRPNKCFDLVNTHGSYDACSDPNNITYTGDEDLEWILAQPFTKEDFLYIDTLKLLCGKSKNLHDCTIKLDNGLVFYDGDHFSLEGAALLGEKAWKYYKNEMNEFGVK